MKPASKTISEPIENAANQVVEEVASTNSEDKQIILETINQNSRLSFSFLLLLLGSTIITALGLLLNDSAIVIGGMIISPLMWPLLKTAISISYGYKRSIQSTLVLLIGSILLVCAVSAILAYISPLKSTTQEILARTSPSFFHIIIGLAGGAVATLAITNKRISTNLAGVAVATSLHPPLVTSAIGFALGEWEIFYHAMILFVTNAISIIFVATISFSLIGFRRKSGKELRNKSLAVTAITLIILAIPLFSFLKNQSFESVAYQQIREQLRSELHAINPEITVESVSTQFNEQNNDIVDVEAQLWLPADFTLSNFEQRQLTRSIETAINRDINLQLQLQRKISLVSEEDVAREQIREHLEDLFINQVSANYPSLSIDSLNTQVFDGVWNITAVLRGDPDNAPTLDELQELENYLTSQTGPGVTLTVEVIPLVRLETSADMISKLEEATQIQLVEENFLEDNIENILVDYSKSPEMATVTAQIDRQALLENSIATTSAATNIRESFDFPIFFIFNYSEE